jgi:hypothetical protein
MNRAANTDSHLLALAAVVAATSVKKPAVEWNPADYMSPLPVARKLVGIIL